MRFGGLAVTLILAAATCAAAAPVDFAHVSAGATWVVHVDVDAVRSSIVCQHAYEKLLETRRDVEKQLEGLRSEIGLDVRKDLHGVTAYGSRIGKNEGVLLVHVAADQKLLLDRVQRAPDHKAASYRSYELHSWTDAKGKKNERPVTGAFYDAGLIVLAPTMDELKKAIDVLGGHLPGLKANTGPLSEAVPAGTILVARAVGLSGAELPYKSPLLTQSEAFRFAVGEHQGETFVEAQLTVKSVETATQVKATLEGLRAMAELQRTNQPDVVKLIGKLKVDVKDNVIRVDFRESANDLWALVQKGWDRSLAAPGGTPSSKSGGKN